MGYNYSPYLLRVHRDLVDNLINLAETRQYQRHEYTDTVEAQRARHLINNLLSSLARHQPKLAWVRRDVRTWMRYEDGLWVMHVGVPPEGMPIHGAPPKPLTLPGSATPVQPTSRVLTLDAITRENVAEAMMQIAKAKEDGRITEVKIINPPDAAGVAYLTERLAPEFTKLDGDKPLRFERRG